MLDLEVRLDELNQLGQHQRMRMVSGPQGPRVVLDGRPVLLLCSGNALGLADHPQVRQAAADAAMRWGVGAGAARVSCGTMTLHKRLGGAVGHVHRPARGAALRLGRARQPRRDPGARAPRRDRPATTSSRTASIVDGCRLSGADVVAYRHADAEHLAWALRQCDGRAALIATDGMFGMDGDVGAAGRDRRPGPPVRRPATGRRGPLARARSAPAGAATVAEAGLEDQVDIITGTLGQGARLLRWLRGLRPRDRPLPRPQRPHAAALDRAPARRRRRRDGRAGPAGGPAAAGWRSCA